MNPTVIIAALLPLASALAIGVQARVERRRAVVHQRVAASVGAYRGTIMVGVASPLQRPAASAGLSMQLNALPASVAKPIQAEIEATGGHITLIHLVVTAGVVGGAVFFLSARFLALPWFFALPLALIAALVATVMLVRYGQARFQARFLSSFPDALDLIVRAVRAGLPLNDAIENVGGEISGPVGDTFRHIHNRVAIGLELEEELKQAAERIRTIEFRFFVVALSLQRRTGGNLAETLENLSLTIRRRKELTLKARALTSESRASAWTIAVLPFVAGTAIYFLSPGYMETLFEDPRGRVILGLAMLGLVTGGLIMRSMVKAAAR